jgi:hypothetical protein
MTDAALDRFVEQTRSAWGPLSTELVATLCHGLEGLLAASPFERWLAGLSRDRPAQMDLHRDADLGFLLLAHAEQAGLYRPPHDHGRSWVLYGILEGEIEMGTYARLQHADGTVRLVRRGSTVLRAGQVQAYLPGDIHDTCCLTRSALLLRFTERDLKMDADNGHPVTRYVQQRGAWTTGAAA